jgi:hypothetical protein
MIERALGKIPVCMAETTVGPEREYFDANLKLNWPSLCPDSKSRVRVQKMLFLENLVQDRDLRDFIYRLLDINPARRMNPR